MLSHASAASAAATPPPKGAALKLVVDPAAPAVGLDGLAQLSPAVTPVAPAKPNDNTNITSSGTTTPKEVFALDAPLGAAAASSDTAAATTMDCEMDDAYEEGFALGFESAGVISSDVDATACSRGYSDGYSDGFAGLEANPPSVFASEMTGTGAAAAAASTVVSVAEQEMMEEEEAEDDDDDVEFAIGYDDGYEFAIEDAYNTGHDDGLQDSEL
jgi:hypothetical protein